MCFSYFYIDMFADEVDESQDELYVARGVAETRADGEIH